MRYRKTIVASTVGLFVLSLVGMSGPVQKQFFPSSDRPEVLIEVFMPEGSSIGATDQVAQRLEAILVDHADVRSLAAYVGASERTSA